MIDSILEFNARFVADKGYEPYVTDKYPARKLAILSCMDTRLTVLLQEALGLRNGDAKIIRNAGAVIPSPWDSAMQSLIVAVYELGVEEIMVVAHTDCGACNMSFHHFRKEMLRRGIPEAELQRTDVDLERWLEGFHDTEKSVRDTMDAIIRHPLMPKDITVRGFIMETANGELTEVKQSCQPDTMNQSRISRIRQMEEIYDRVLRDVRTLREYQESGLWLEDYEADERGEIPASLKRGVLSQDGLDELFSEVSPENNE